MNKTFDSKDLVGKLTVACIRLFGAIPLSIASKAGRIIGHVTWALAKSSRQITLKNLELCFPEKTKAELRALAKDSIIETTVTAFEMAPAWVQPVDRLLATITHAENEQIFEDAKKQGRGVVFIVPHYGNWDLANYYMGSNASLVAMFKPGESPALNKLMLQSRTKVGEMVTADKKGVLALFSAVRNGKVTGILPDQEPSVSSGVWVPFFGIPALTPVLVSKLVNKTNAVAIGFGCQRNPDGKTYHVFYEPVEDEMYSNNLEDSAAAMNRCIERIIRREPSQYQWEYKRFKRRPDGSQNPYR